eukprot:105246-Rhodomonas_salina.2
MVYPGKRIEMRQTEGNCSGSPGAAATESTIVKKVVLGKKLRITLNSTIDLLQTHKTKGLGVPLPKESYKLPGYPGNLVCRNSRSFGFLTTRPSAIQYMYPGTRVPGTRVPVPGYPG